MAPKMVALAPLLLLATVSVLVPLTFGRSYLRADGRTDTYTLIQNVFGGPSSAVEVPDCGHTAFGRHITQVQDASVNGFVFAFHAHIHVDDDRCQRFDRQRTEMKTNDNLPNDELTGHLGDYMTLSWDFKLDAGFLPPYSFCHIHQLKAVGGDDSMPIITLTPRRNYPDNIIQLIHMDSKGGYEIVDQALLEPWLGEWVHAVTNVTLRNEGSYSLEIKRKSDDRVLLSYKNDRIDMWRNSTDFIRPKWGIYRSVQERAVSRDETVLFHEFCVGKGTQSTCS